MKKIVLGLGLVIAAVSAAQAGYNNDDFKRQRGAIAVQEAAAWCMTFDPGYPDWADSVTGLCVELDAVEARYSKAGVAHHARSSIGDVERGTGGGTELGTILFSAKADGRSG
ncbi:MAG: hypothetical protein LBU35_03775, partial [Holosporales bacterium]|nr:hypothetical protein [Holosporales bacterium]